MIKKIKIFPNDNEKCLNVLEELTKKINDYGFVIDNENPDLLIAIGGDGSFLRMVKQNNYQSLIPYAGINAGTLGFLQEFKTDEIDLFFQNLKDEKYKIEDLCIEEIKVYTKDEIVRFVAVNEVVIREENLNVLFLKVLIDNNHLEDFAGDGLIISTTSGSTAHNFSAGGSIVYGSLHTLQIMPICALNNLVYRSLKSSLILPEKIKVTLETGVRRDLLISVDGENKVVKDVRSLEITSCDKLKVLRKENYNFPNKVRDKFLKID
jgi:NAD+ kinase